jgi:Zn finger protein HypA/HybF involved in hydrogenase expression
MKRRDFFAKTGCGAAGIMLAHFGLKAGTLPNAPEEQKEKIMKLLAKMGKSKEEIDNMMKKMKETLPMVQEQCICKTCPTYVKEEKVVGFCHPLISKSEIITEERGCDCPKCPVYKKMEMKNGYYCTRMSEMEQEAAKKA